MSKWDELTMAEKAEMMKVAVRNGITKLQDIRDKYNEFAEGGDTEEVSVSPNEAARMGAMVGAAIATKPKGYIGGSPSEARSKYWQTDNEMRMITDSVANQYGISPSLLRTRMDNEGYTDARINEINKDVKEGTNRVLMGTALFNSEALPYVAGSEFGLDDVADYINNGTVNLINENWGDGQFQNEQGRWTRLAIGHNYSDNIGIMAATLKAFKDIARKDFPNASEADLERYASAYYNRGIKGGREWVKRGAKGYNIKALGGNTFKGGGYKPSDSVKKRISTWEGAAMTGAVDPLSGKWGKNRSFEAEADSFYNALPASIRSQVLSNPELADNLFSYSYNVGAGNFKKRVVPALEKYYTGNGSPEEVANSMWATGDKKLRGLKNRRAVERKGVVDALTPAFTPEPADNTFIFNPFAIQAENTYTRPVVIPDEDSYVTAHEVSPSGQKAQEIKERFDAINRFNTILNMLNMDTSAPTYMPNTGNPFLDAIGVLTNSNAHGGKIQIKPSHRGRLTELKKRTGKSEAELYRTGGPAVRKMITFARNARKWKHGLGGNLFDDGGDSNPMNYDYRGTVFDDELKRQGITHIAELPEITITGRDRTKPYRSAFDGSVKPYIEYFGALSHGLQPLSLSQHVGAAADAIQGKRNYFDSLFNGNSGFFSDEYAAEHPITTIGGNLLGDIAGPMSFLSAVNSAKNAAQPFASAALKNTANIQHQTGTALSGPLEETIKAIEKGRNDMLDWIRSPFYKTRLRDEPLYRVADDVVNDASQMIENAPIRVKDRMQLDKNGNVNGTTTTRPVIEEKVLPDGTKIMDLNTGLDVDIASDLGEQADKTTLHELLHYMTANSKGTPYSKAGERIINKGWLEPTETHFDAINIIHKNRSKGWQDYILDQNDVLLPKYDEVVKMVMERPEDAKAALIKTGRTPADADTAVQSLRNRYSEWYDIQEQRAYLQELFLSKIKPNLKNPNDAAEIEAFMSEHPEILDESPAYKYIQEVRPGTLKQYAGYFASALSTLPFINKMTKE